ncbi:MAG TPA: glycosyltransferase family 2 protein [Chitinophagaceae bacterium]|nr:glycosyltransferase family 2 protein [Chitinophagaceae bacterium]
MLLMPEETNDNIFIIIPVYNEQLSLLSKIVDTLLTRYKVILVDDASLERIILPKRDNLFLLRHPVNLGQGAALQTGISYALRKGAEYIIMFDGDGQHSATDIPALLMPLLKNEADISLASRFLKQSKHNASFVRLSLLHIARIVNYIFTGLYLSDAHNGFRAITKKAAAKLRLKENRMAHATEILFEIKKHRWRYTEVPVNIIYTDYSKRKGQSLFNSVRIFFDLVLHKLFE